MSFLLIVKLLKDLNARAAPAQAPAQATTPSPQIKLGGAGCWGPRGLLGAVVRI